MMVPVISAASIKIFVSVLPQKFIVERVGGEYAYTEALVGRGYSPAGYQPTPQQIARLSTADLYVRSGLPFEESWMGRIRSVNPSMKILDMRQATSASLLQHKHGEHKHGIDPHVWTDPIMVLEQAARIRDELSLFAPDSRRAFEENYRRLEAELMGLDKRIRVLLESRKSDAFLVFHPAWGYFAQRYGLRQIAAEFEGKEPTAKRLTLLIEEARAAGIKVIFVQPEFSSHAVQVLAEELGARVERADPLAENYFDAMIDFVSMLVGDNT